MRIVPCGPERAEDVHRLTQAAFASHRHLDPPTGALRETPEVVADELATGGGAIAEIDEEPVGCLRWHIEASGDLYVHRVAVVPERQRQGLGRALMTWVEEEARRLGCEAISVGVRVVLHDNIAFYRSLSYEVVAERRHEGYDRTTSLDMRKVLSRGRHRGGARAHTRVDRPVVPPRADALRGSSDVGLFGELPTMLFLVDGNNLLWRAAHGPRAPFAALDGRDLTPLFRFFTLLRRSLGTYGLFAECVVCFDGADAWSERLEIDATYKGNRTYEDKDLSFMGWLPEIRVALDGSGVTVIELTDSEADDVIATLAARAEGRPVRILSTDRDYYQLITPSTIVVNPHARPGLVDEAALLARFGVTARQWCDLRALAGDPSDGIPGLPGIGMAKAAAMLADGKTLDELRSSIAERWEDVCRWRELIRLRTDIAVGFEPTGTPTPRLPPPSAVCAELGLI